VIDKKYIYSQ